MCSTCYGLSGLVTNILLPCIHVDPFQLKATVKDLHATVRKLKSDQETIVFQLKALESMLQVKNCTEQPEAGVQVGQFSVDADSISPSPAYFPPTSPLRSQPHDHQFQPCPTPPPLPPPLPSPFTPAQQYYETGSGDVLRYACSQEMWNSQPSPFVGSSLPPQQSYKTHLNHQSYTACYQKVPAMNPQPSFGGQPPRCPPVKSRKKCTTLTSTAIPKATLKDPDEGIARYKNYHTISKAPTLATKLASQAYFGEQVLKRCTVLGYREQPSLPIDELNDLKQKLFSLFPQFWTNPLDFEPTWGACVEAIGQCCKRLRNN